jgi:integrase
MRDPKTVPFGDFAEAVLARCLARPRTVEGYRTWIGHVEPRLGAIPVGKITEAHIEEALAEARVRGLSEKSLANLLGAIRKVLRKAGSHAADGMRVAVPAPDVRPLAACEAMQLRQALRPGLPADDAILALLGSGLRLAELERLQPRDWDGKVARVVSRPGAATKSGRARNVEVASYARDAVWRLVLSGMPARRTLRRQLDRRCREAGIPRIRVHDLRHTRVTLLLLGGVPLRYVSEVVGHHDPSYTIRVYGHLTGATPEERAAWADAA